MVQGKLPEEQMPQIEAALEQMKAQLIRPDENAAAAQKAKVTDEVHKEKAATSAKSYETISNNYALKTSMSLDEIQKMVSLQRSVVTAAPGEGQENAGKAYQKFLDEMKQEHAESYQNKLLEYASLTGEAPTDVALNSLKLLEAKQSAFAGELEKIVKLAGSFQTEMQSFQTKLDGMKVGSDESTMMANASDDANALYEKLIQGTQQTMIQYWMMVSTVLKGALTECDGELGAKLSVASEAVLASVEEKKSLCQPEPEPSEEAVVEEAVEQLADDEIPDDEDN